MKQLKLGMDGHHSSKAGSKDSSEETFMSLIRDFCGYTSAHGFERVMSAKEWIRKAFWSLLFIAAITVLGLQVHTLYHKYKNRPLVTLVTLQSDTSLPFPAITLCNFNALKYDSLLDSNLTALKDIFQKQNASSLGPSDEEEYKRRRRSVDNAENSFPDDEDDSPGSGSLDEEDDLDEEFIESEKVAILMAEEDDNYLSSLGHQFQDMVLSCTFRGMSCSNYTEKLWNVYWHYKYGNCYVFNSGITNSGAKKPVLRSNKAGPSHGLNLELNIEQDEYLGSFAPEAGARLDITNQGYMPFPFERGLSLAPGFATAIGLRKVILERKDPFKNNRCRGNTSTHEWNLYTRMYNATYSATACKESCLARSQYQICGCMEYKFPVDREPVCNITNRIVNACLNKVQKMFRDNKLNCSRECPPPCRQEEFKVSSSFATWPADSYEDFFQTELEKRGKFVWTDFGSSRKNVLKVQIFYEELNVEVIEEKRSYELADFASDIGGQLGLWIGFSVLTIAEFLEFAMLLICLALKKCPSSKKSKTTVMEMRERDSK